jgi:hypothetical protein
MTPTPITTRRSLIGLTAAALTATATAANAAPRRAGAVTMGRGISAEAAQYSGPLVRSGHLALGGCVIRLSPDPHGPGVVPYVHANGAHYNAGVTDVHVNNSGDLEIHVASEGLPIISCGVWMDESVGGNHGVTGGISGGGAVSRVRLNRDGHRLWLSGRTGRVIAGEVSNVWCSWTYYAGPL